MNKRINLIAAAFALTALSYGLARFAYGLLLPQIREDLSLSPSTAGWIGSGAFAAYCLGIVLAFMAGPRLGERIVACLAGLLATCGMALVTIATSGGLLGLAMALAGLSTGLTSPPLAAAVARRFDAPMRSRANGAINSGTAAGIILSGAAVLAIDGAWRELYMLFMVAGAAVTVWLWFAMPGRDPLFQPPPPVLPALQRPGVPGLCLSAALMGAASTTIWTFGADIMRDSLHAPDSRIALAWIVLGAAGLAGAGTGVLTDRFGIKTVHRLALFMMGTALVILLAATFLPLLIFGVMALFGAGYILSSGAFLLWGIDLFPGRADIGLGLPFLMIAGGQTLGATLFGLLSEWSGYPVSFLCFASLLAGAGFWSPNGPDPQKPAEGFSA